MKLRYKRYSDTELAALIQRQDTYAFNELYDRYCGPMYSFALRFLDSRADAEDAVQEAFTNFYIKAPGVTFTHSVKAYLYRILRNSLLNTDKHEKIRQEAFESFKAVYKEGVETTDSYINERQLVELVDRELENMPPKMRAVYEMSRKHYMSHKQIAHALEISEATVKSQINNALSRLRAVLGMVFWAGVMQAILWIHRTF